MHHLRLLASRLQIELASKLQDKALLAHCSDAERTAQAKEEALAVSGCPLSLIPACRSLY